MSTSWPPPIRGDPAFPPDRRVRRHAASLLRVVHFNNGCTAGATQRHNSSLAFPCSFEPFGHFPVAASSYGPPSLQSSQRHPARTNPASTPECHRSRLHRSGEDSCRRQHGLMNRISTSMRTLSTSTRLARHHGGQAATIIKRPRNVGHEQRGQD